MDGMFQFCRSLTKLNLLNFIVEKVERFGHFGFAGLIDLLKKKNIIATDKKILE